MYMSNKTFSILIGTALVIIGAYIGCLTTFTFIPWPKYIKPITTDTIIDNGDIWYSIGDSTNKIEWRHIRNSNDSMAIVHIHQGDSLYTWIGKPCNCY